MENDSDDLTYSGNWTYGDGTQVLTEEGISARRAMYEEAVEDGFPGTYEDFEDEMPF